MSTKDDRGNQTDRPGMLERIKRSVTRGPVVPHDDTDRKLIVVNNLILHNRPVRVDARTLRYTHTFGLGGMSTVLFGLLVATGVLLMFVYEPSPGLAYDSIVSLQSDVLFGKLVRNIHHWSANFLIAIVLLHLLRVFFTGGFYAPRQFNWVLGLLLLCCVLVSNFTGYLLPWDQLSYWAITIVTGMLGYIPLFGGWLVSTIRGGAEIGSSTLIIFYTVHTTVVPVLVIVLMAFHFWRVRRVRGVVVPLAPGETPEAKPDKVLFLPNLFVRELSAAMILVAVVMTVAVLFDAPLGSTANPGMSPNPAKAPWYFMGFQELLLHFHPVAAVLIIPLAGAIGLLLIPYLRYDDDTSGVFMMSHKGRRMAAAAAAFAAAATSIAVVTGEYWVDFAAWFPRLPAAVSNGLIHGGILFSALAGVYVLFKRRYEASNNEAVQALFVFIATAFVILTIAGVWFRGEGMALVWPWMR